ALLFFLEVSILILTHSVVVAWPVCRKKGREGTKKDLAGRRGAFIHFFCQSYFHMAAFSPLLKLLSRMSICK
uniref:Uncharacterized protein n=1 Tax=Coturnix japonica TaxID=93934 RepID=A0A8C2U1U8_COTJA